MMLDRLRVIIMARNLLAHSNGCLQLDSALLTIVLIVMLLRRVIYVSKIVAVQ